MTWRARLAAIRAIQLHADSANSANSPPSGNATGPIGAIGTIGMEANGCRPGEHDVAEAEAMAEHYAAAPSALPYLPGDPDPLRDGLLIASRMRPPAWSDEAPPPPRAFCSCCGRHAPEAGGRWWSPRRPRSDGTGTGPGWRCWTCHPPVHLAPRDLREVRT